MSAEEPRERDSKGYDRARDEREPGAHSGGESRERDRVIPGTASASEGYAAEHAEGGTAQGDPIAGRRVPEEEPQDDDGR
ncbi:hypothetical protein GCM10027168_43780 [Streptomyces capparidis]